MPIGQEEEAPSAFPSMRPYKKVLVSKKHGTQVSYLRARMNNISERDREREGLEIIMQKIKQRTRLSKRGKIKRVRLKK